MVLRTPLKSIIRTGAVHDARRLEMNDKYVSIFCLLEGYAPHAKLTLSFDKADKHGSN